MKMWWIIIQLVVIVEEKSKAEALVCASEVREKSECSLATAYFNFCTVHNLSEIAFPPSVLTFNTFIFRNIKAKMCSNKSNPITLYFLAYIKYNQIVSNSTKIIFNN